MIFNQQGVQSGGGGGGGIDVLFEGSMSINQNTDLWSYIDDTYTANEDSIYILRISNLVVGGESMDGSNYYVLFCNIPDGLDFPTYTEVYDSMEDYEYQITVIVQHHYQKTFISVGGRSFTATINKIVKVMF